MKLTDLLDRECVIAELHGQDKPAILAELAHVLAGRVEGLDRDGLVGVLMEREKLGSTGIGEGIAIPHGKVEGLDDLVVAFGRSRTGAAFEAMDDQPVYLFFLLVAPDNSVGVHLKTLAKITRMLKDRELRQALVEAEDADAIYRLISEKDEDY